MPRSTIVRKSCLFRLLTFDLHSLSHLRNLRALFACITQIFKKHNTMEDVRLIEFICIRNYCAYFIQMKRAK